MHYDIIGDIHGHADHLAGLLRLMDYAEIGACGVITSAWPSSSGISWIADPGNSNP